MKLKRQGIATQIYDKAEEEVGTEILPQVLDHNVSDPQISNEAFLFWYARKPKIVEEILEAVTDKNRQELLALMKRKKLEIPK